MHHKALFGARHQSNLPKHGGTKRPNKTYSSRRGLGLGLFERILEMALLKDFRSWASESQAWRMSRGKETATSATLFLLLLYAMDGPKDAAHRLCGRCGNRGTYVCVSFPQWLVPSTKNAHGHSVSLQHST